MDHREIIKSIKAPTMVIAGSQDAGTTLEMGEFVAKNIPGATLKMFDAAHIANVECGTPTPTRCSASCKNNGKGSVRPR